MIAWAVANSPPAPAPCRARKAMSSPMFWERPARAEPVKKMTMAVWKIRLRPKRSLILPQRGTDTVDVRMYAVTTHDSCRSPPRSPTIVGRAVATIVWSRAANSIPAMSPRKTT